MTPARRPVFSLDVACNDDNGGFAGRAAALQLNWGNEIVLELEPAVYRREPGFALLDGRFRLARRLWPYTGSRACVGNLLWDRFGLSPDVTAELLAHLAASGQWHPAGGWTAVLDQGWRDKASAADFRRILERETSTGGQDG